MTFFLKWKKKKRRVPCLPFPIGSGCSLGLFQFLQFSSAQLLSRSLRPPKLQHARPPCPSLNGLMSIKSVMPSRHLILGRPLLLLPQSLPASESFPMSQLFTWGDQSTGVSASASFPPKKSQGWSPSEWSGWISLQSKGLSRVFSNTTVQKHQ